MRDAYAQLLTFCDCVCVLPLLLLCRLYSAWWLRAAAAAGPV
jgi:hypothetical protein